MDKPMGERRVELRMQTNRQVQVALIDGAVVCLGTLVDLSVSGARIRLTKPVQRGRKFELMFDEHQQRFTCTVIWANENEIGVAFDVAHAAPAKPPTN